MTKDEWQPISTAPRDGTHILLSCGPEVWFGWWQDRKKHAGEWVFADPDCAEGINGWIAGYGPTYWHPLPPPPTDKP